MVKLQRSIGLNSGAQVGKLCTCKRVCWAKGLNFLALVNGMVIPEQHDRATHTPNYLSQKRDDLLAGSEDADINF